MLKYDRSLTRAWQDRERADPQRFSAVSELPDRREQGDLLSILHDSSFRSLFKDQAAGLGFDDVEAWICTFRSSSGGPVYSPHETAANENPHFLLFLDEIRRRCVIDLENQLRAACISQEIPPEGVCLVFPDTLGACYFTEYSMRADHVQVRISDSFKYPRAILGLDDAAALPNARSKNLAKSFIQSGHKTIVHGGVLTHVDRRLHPLVFGPTIDTLLLASILADYVRQDKPSSIMEIGVGSGNIYTTAAVNSTDELVLCGVDMVPSAVLCTDANLSRDREVFGLDKVKSDLVVGKFNASFFASKFDLIVSNPPYISGKPTPGLGRRIVHEGSTNESGLVPLILSSLPALLREGGRALVMLSSTTSEVDGRPPPGYELVECLPGGTVAVPFDVDDVLDDEARLQKLLDLGRIERTQKGYDHQLRPVWVMRR